MALRPPSPSQPGPSGAKNTRFRRPRPSAVASAIGVPAGSVAPLSIGPGGPIAIPDGLEPGVDLSRLSSYTPTGLSIEYPIDCSYTSLLTQDFGDDFRNQSNCDAANVVIQSSLVPAMNSQGKTKGRTNNYTEEEDILLVSAYLNISKDAIQGNQQKDGRFWLRIEKYFHENRKFESDRNWSSLKHRWQALQKDVNVFQGCHDSVERKNKSGKTSNDKLTDAKAMFHQLTGKSFSVFHAWNILRHEPKWIAKCNKSNMKETTIPGSSSTNVENVGNEGQFNGERPPGRKAEKERLGRVRKRGDGDFDPFVDEVKKFTEVRQEIEKDRKERDNRMYELEKKKYELEQDQHDTKIMELDTSKMDDLTKKYFEKMKEEILARRFGSSQS